MLVYEMKTICYNMYKWGVQTDVGGAITEKSQFHLFSSDPDMDPQLLE